MKTQTYDQIWGNSNEIVFVECEDDGRISQLTISTIWLVNQILAAVTISLFGNFLLFVSRARLVHGLFIMCFVRRVCG